MTYYEIIFGSGLAWCNRYVVRTEYPTTEYQALVDVLIDYAKEKGYSFVPDPNDYEWVDEGTVFYMKANPDRLYYPDEYVVGGNCSDVLIHYGEFRINEIAEEEIAEADGILDL